MTDGETNPEQELNRPLKDSKEPDRPNGTTPPAPQTTNDQTGGEGHPKSLNQSNESGDKGNHGETPERDAQPTDLTPNQQVRVQAGIIQGENIDVAGTIYKYFNYNFSNSDGENRVSMTSARFLSLSGPELQQRASGLLCEPRVRETWVEILERRHLLLMTGRPGLGRTSAALLAGTRLLARNEALKGVLELADFDDTLEVDFDQIVQERGAYEKRLVILVFRSHHNGANLKHLRSILSSSRLEALARGLMAQRTYLILVLNSDDIKEVQLALPGVRVELRPPSSDLLIELIRRVGNKMLDGLDVALREELRGKTEGFLTELGPSLAARLGTFPKGARFAQQHLLQVVDGSLQLEEALERVDDLASWLLDDLPRSPGAFYLALAAILSVASARRAGAPSPRVVAVRRRLERYFRRELRERPNPADLPTRRSAESLLQTARLQRSGALPDRLSFRQDDPEKLWRLLRLGGFELTGRLLPFLKELAEDDHPELRRIGAAALGQLGGLDPEYVILPVMHRWAKHASADSLGHLLLGVQATGDETYVERCMEVLDTFLAGSQREAAHTALLALARLGAVAPARFTSAVGRVLAAGLDPDRQGISKLVEGLRKLEEEVHEARDADERQRLQKDLRDMLWVFVTLCLTGFLDDEGKKRLRLILVVELAIHSFLLDAQEPAAAFAALAATMRDDREKAAPALSFLFLKEGGILERLRTAGRREPGAEGSRPGRLLRGLDPSDGSPAALGALLEQVFVATRTFPGAMRQVLLGSFRSALAELAREATGDPVARAAFVQVLAGLFGSSERELSELILARARDSVPTDSANRPLHELAKDAILGTAKSGADRAAGGR